LIFGNGDECGVWYAYVGIFVSAFLDFNIKTPSFSKRALHILEWGYRYSPHPGLRTLSLHTGTALDETPQGWSFALANNRDVFGIKKNLTDTLRTEIHVLSASNKYRSFSFHTGTALHETGAPYDRL